MGGNTMIENISCFEILEELYKEGTDFKKELRQIVYDLGCIKMYIRFWRSYSFLKQVKNSLLPRKSNRTNTTEFIEDCELNDIPIGRKSKSVKGTTKFILSLVFQEIRHEDETIKDMLYGGVEVFFTDKKDELSLILLSSEDKELIKDCFANVKKYEKSTPSPRYDIFKLSSNQQNNIMSLLLKFKMHLEDEEYWDLDYKTLENYLSQENLLEPLEEMTSRVVSSNCGTEVQRNLMGISFLLAKLRMGITDSEALQTREITRDKGRKNLLNIPNKMNLDELAEESEKLQEELEDLLEPLLSSPFICYHLYKFYFECRGNLQI